MEKIGLIKNKIVQHLKDFPIWITSLLIVLAPLIYVQNPDGSINFEVAKVRFTIVFVGIILTFSIVVMIIKNIGFNKFELLFLIAILLSFVISFLLSDYREMSLVGNSFRYQGLLTHILFIAFGFVIYKLFDKKNIHIVLISLILSSIIQSLLALQQIFGISINSLGLVKTHFDPEKLLTGLYINGSFGQSNWFAGLIFLGLIALSYYWFHGNIKNRYLNYLFKFVGAITFLLFIFVIVYSQSMWTVLSVGIVFGIIVLFEFLPKKIFAVIMTIGTILGIIGMGIIYSKWTEFNIRFEIWNQILRIFQNSPIHKVLFGFGFDVLGEEFKARNILSQFYVDRAHNFFLDVLFQMGVVILTIFTGMIIFLFSKVKLILKNPLNFFVVLMLCMWIFRALVDESGIVNLTDLIILIAASFALTRVEVNVLKNHEM